MKITTLFTANAPHYTHLHNTPLVIIIVEGTNNLSTYFFVFFWFESIIRSRQLRTFHHENADCAACAKLRKPYLVFIFLKGFPSDVCECVHKMEQNYVH